MCDFLKVGGTQSVWSEELSSSGDFIPVPQRIVCCTAFKDYRFSLLVSGVLHYLQCTVLDLCWMWSGLSISPGSLPYWLQGITPGHPFWTSGAFPTAALLLGAHPGACLQIAWFCLNENSFDRHHFVLRLTSCSMILCFHLGYSSR